MPYIVLVIALGLRCGSQISVNHRLRVVHFFNETPRISVSVFHLLDAFYTV